MGNDVRNIGTKTEVNKPAAWMSHLYLQMYAQAMKKRGVLRMMATTKRSTIGLRSTTEQVFDKALWEAEMKKMK